MSDNLEKGMGAKKKRRYMKLNLMETSVVGIPAYPDAHLSLIKALQSLTERREETMSETENQEAVKAEVVEVKSEPVAEVVKEAEQVEVAKEVEKAVEVDSMEETLKKIETRLTEAINKAFEQLSVKRGLVETQEAKEAETVKSLKSMSIGELALKSNWLK